MPSYNCTIGVKEVSDRKYRHRGYMDSDREAERPKPQTGPKPGPRQAPGSHEGPRSPKMMAFGEATKCSACGAKTPSNITFDSTCSNCRAELHSCRQCSYFDPGAHFECSKSIPKKIVNKNARNTCELFAPRTVIERETSSKAPNDPRQAFAKLFKK